MTTKTPRHPAGKTRLPIAALLCTFCVFAAAADRPFSFQVDTHAIVQHGIYKDAVSDQGKSILDRTRGTAIVDLVFYYQPASQHQLFSLLRYAHGNALNNTGGLTLPPYGGDVEDNVQNINGHNRDYLLEAWYRYALDFNSDTSLAITGGLVNAANYIDTNAFAGDEFSQFMNSAFTLNNIVTLPAYDPGISVELDTGNWSFKTVAMVTKDEESGSYSYLAAEAGLATRLLSADGNYRIFAFTTSDDFKDPNKSKNKPLQGVGVSIDQYINEWFGVFARYGYQGHIAPDYERLFSMGIHLNGLIWNRPADSAGVAMARMEGENHSSLEHTNVLEAYIRLVYSERFDLSFDIQYMNDERDRPEKNPSATILGTRLNFSF